MSVSKVPWSVCEEFAKFDREILDFASSNQVSLSKLSYDIESILTQMFVCLRYHIILIPSGGFYVTFMHDCLLEKKYGKIPHFFCIHSDADLKSVT